MTRQRRDLRRILRRDLGEDLPDWIDRLLDPINNLIEEILDERESGIPVSSLRTQRQKTTVNIQNLGDEFVIEKAILEPVQTIQVVSLLDPNGNQLVDTIGWSQNNTQVRVFFSTLTGSVDVNLLLFY